jgi:hypothetical protein
MLSLIRVMWLMLWINMNAIKVNSMVNIDLENFLSIVQNGSFILHQRFVGLTIQYFIMI